MSIFNDIPEAERSVDGLDYYRHLAGRARETSFGLPARERAIVNLCCRVEEAERELAYAGQSVADAEAQSEELVSLRNQVKGLNMTIGRMKKRKDND